MPDTELISQLLERWESAQEQGQTLEAEELCGDHPELLDLVKRQIAALKAFDSASNTKSGRETKGYAATVHVAPPVVAGYEIVGELGRGGMGVVYRALDLRLKRPVALKMILAGSHAGPAQRERFRREAEAVARLQHPNIVQVFQLGDQDGLPFFALELVEGGESRPPPRRRAAAGAGVGGPG